MSFYLCVNGHFHAFDFSYVESRTPSRLEPTLVPGSRPATRQPPSAGAVHMINLMTKAVISVDLYDPCTKAREAIQAHGIHHLPVLSYGKLVGIISDRDLMMSGKKKLVHEAMAHTLVVCDEDTGVAEACEVLAKENISALPVVDKKFDLVGIVTTKDILKWVYKSGRAA